MVDGNEGSDGGLGKSCRFKHIWEGVNLVMRLVLVLCAVSYEVLAVSQNLVIYLSMLCNHL